MKDRGEFTEEVSAPPYADSKPGVTGNKTRPPDLAAPPSTTLRNGAGRETAGTPDGGRLVFAVIVAMLLGVACGLWLSAGLASAALEASALPSPSPPILNADLSEAATTESAPLNREDDSTAVANSTLPTAAGETDNEKEAISTPPRVPAKNAEGGRGVSNAVRPADKAETSSETAAGRKNAPVRGVASPCPLYASASALTVRGGGEATLVLGGPNQKGRVAVTTPDWSDIAVFSEGPAGDNRGWMKYSVRSVSKRAGVFSVRVNGPCGSLNIPVRVTRP